MSEEQVTFAAHSAKQFDVIASDADITIAATGIQWGKTASGAMWFKRMLHTYTDPKDNFIVTSPDYKTLQQSTLPLSGILGWIVFGDALSPEAILGVVIATVGLAILTWPRRPSWKP